MARKDNIFKSFLEHELIHTKYNLQSEELPNTVREALNSDIPVVKAIALLVDNLEKSPSSTDNELRNIILQYLNTAI